MCISVYQAFILF